MALSGSESDDAIFEKKWLELSWRVTNCKWHQSRSLTSVNHSPSVTPNIQTVSKLPGTIAPRKLFFTNYIASSAFRIHFLWHFAAFFTTKYGPTFICTLCVAHLYPTVRRTFWTWGDLYSHFLSSYGGIAYAHSSVDIDASSIRLDIHTFYPYSQAVFTAGVYLDFLPRGGGRSVRG